MKQQPYGNKGNNNPMPEAYLLNHSNSDLIIIEKSFEIARGRWISTYEFMLMRLSIIRKDKSKGGKNKNIMKCLHNDSIVGFDGEEQYTLLHDILLYSPSMAAKLVLGYPQANGYDLWRNKEGITLGHLAWPENPKYKEKSKATIELANWM